MSATESWCSENCHCNNVYHNILLNLTVCVCVPPGDSVVVCVNNLGGLSCLEMAVVTRAAVMCLGDNFVDSNVAQS